MLFLRELVRAPHTIGAIAPSSKQLAIMMVETSVVRGASTILEIGAGTGVITEQILYAKRDDADFVALERNPNFASTLRARFPGLRVIIGCASKLRMHTQEYGFHTAESIVSGLPWAIFDRVTQMTILDEIRDMLNGGGVFTTFAYYGPHLLPAGQRFRKLLEATFRDVRTSPIVFRNVPPAFVYTCRK